MEGIESLDQKLQVLMEKVSALENEIHQVPSQVIDDGAAPNQVAQIITAVNTLQQKVTALEEKKESESTEEMEVEEVSSEEALDAIAERYRGAGADIGFLDGFFESSKVRDLKTKIFVDSYRFMEEQDVDPQEVIDSWEDKNRAEMMTDAIFEFAQSDGAERDLEKLKKKVLALASNKPPDKEEVEGDSWWES